MNRIVITVASAAAVLFSVPAAAQTAPAAPAAMPFPTKAEKDADLRYFTIETITAKPGARLWTILSKHFIPAAQAAGIPVPVVYHTETGESRSIVISPLTNGPGDLAWQVSPEDLKWMNALAKQEGGEDKAMALWKEYNDGIEHRSRELIHQHVK